jgi:UDP-2-acetamido-3-amino-2,3-dideoxy-glucuronate N-acetyltransferase
MKTGKWKTPKLQTTIADVEVVKLHRVIEDRGIIVAGEKFNQIPFQPNRFFIVSDVPPNEVRGNHAHRLQHQFLIHLQGAGVVLVNDGNACKAIVFNRFDTGLYIPPLIWIQYSCSPNSILLMLASGPYDPKDYIVDYLEFARLKAAKIQDLQIALV